jgi:serine/threonine transporter
MKEIYIKWHKISLIKRIILGIFMGILLVLVAPEKASGIVILGDLFVGALKAIAPILVFFLVMVAVLQHKKGQKSNMKSIVVLYLLGTFLAAVVAVVGSFIFPVELILKATEGSIAPPENIYGVLKGLLMNLVDNPMNALLKGNYIGILFWSILFGGFLRDGKESTKQAD